MSAQGLNSSYRNSQNAYRYTPPVGNTGPGKPGAGIPLAIYATQFASDNTKRLKESALYREYSTGGPSGTPTAVTTGSTTPYNNRFIVPVDYRIVQSNQNRKTYQFGRAVCVAECTGGFPTSALGT
jgi:hypothetical protein